MVLYSNVNFPGADLNLQCRVMSTGSFPLHLAAVAGDTDVMEIMLQAGAKLTVQDNDKCTPLHKVY